MRTVLFLALCTAVVFPVHGQDEPQALQRLVDDLRRTGRILEAEPLLERWLEFETARSGESSEALVPILDQLARLAVTARRYDQAQERYRRAVGIVHAAQGRNSPALIPLLQSLVRAQVIAQAYAEAVGTQMRVISIRINTSSDSNADLAADYVVVARIYSAQQNFRQAASFFSFAVEMSEKLFGLDDPRLLPALDGLASAYRQDQKFEEAAAVLLRAIPIREATVGPHHPDLAQTLDNLGAVYFSQKRFAEAEPAYARSLEIWKRHLGPAHPMVATSLDNLGVTYASQNKFAEAEKIYRQALAIRDDEEVSSLRNLALVLVGQSKHAEAEPYFKRALALLTKPSPALLATLNDYADALEQLKRKVEAARLRARAKKIEAELE
jgi:tetratricopeptide (TPR) repeat protein